MIVINKSRCHSHFVEQKCKGLSNNWYGYKHAVVWIWHVECRHTLSRIMNKIEPFTLFFEWSPTHGSKASAFVGNLKPIADLLFHSQTDQEQILHLAVFDQVTLWRKWRCHYPPWFLPTWWSILSLLHWFLVLTITL